MSVSLNILSDKLLFTSHASQDKYISDYLSPPFRRLLNTDGQRFRPPIILVNNRLSLRKIRSNWTQWIKMTGYTIILHQRTDSRQYNVCLHCGIKLSMSWNYLLLKRIMQACQNWQRSGSSLEGEWLLGVRLLVPFCKIIFILTTENFQ